MNNFYIAFVVYLNLIFVAAKLWDRIQWSWMWVMAPLIALTLIGVLATVGQWAKQNRMRSDLTGVLDGLRNLIEQAKKKEEQAERTIN